jgi:ABC-2 type transport system permease protein
MMQPLIVENGTFINSAELFPRFGYQRSVELVDMADREEWDLPAARRAYKLEDTRFYQQTVFGLESGYLEFEATISTATDQIAIAPGYLQKEWAEGGRRFFHYKMDAPIENYFAIMSGRYDVLRSRYKGIDIEIFHHSGHAYNVEVMQQAVKDSIDYFSENFGPYQHSQARIIEFPGYKSFAQSFPNTIAYSERIGFINDLSDPEIVNSVYYVTAHEMAHQWWGGQVNGANVQGSTMIVETLAQYSALMVTREKYGQAILRKILNFELDSYLRGRTRELIEELPLMRVENQDYIHYRKGSVTMMSLVDLLGEQRMNAALSSFLSEFKFREAIYSTTLDLLAHISRGSNDSEREAVRNLFEEISLYDLRMVSVDVEPFGGGDIGNSREEAQYEVTLLINAHRVEADGQGMETQASLSEYIDIGLFSADPDDLSGLSGADEAYVLYLEKHLINDGENIIKIWMQNYPSWAGIDPFVKMIDRDSADNTIRVRPEDRDLVAL